MNRIYLSLLKISGIILVPVILLIFPANYFDKGESMCLSKVLAGMECYGCGMTRAIMHLIHLDFTEAYQYNKLSFIVLPLLSFLGYQAFVKEVKYVRAVYFSKQIASTQ